MLENALKNHKKDTSLLALKAWLSTYFAQQEIILCPLLGDASFRRYFRFSVFEQTYIAVTSPPLTENNSAFVQISEALAEMKIAVPKVLHADFNRGFLLLTDLGDEVFFRVVRDENADFLYAKALDELVKIQRCQFRLPVFEASSLFEECQMFHYWVVEQHLQRHLSSRTEKMLNETFHMLTKAATEQPHCFTHRDYHSRNLMVLPDQKLGILDFQDAVWGPITYDVVSLLRDCYLQWPYQKVMQWLQNFHAESIKSIIPSFEQFVRWFDLMGVQRHLKASFIFARKYHRDGVSDYLKEIPRAMRYMMAVGQNYPEHKVFFNWIEEAVAPYFLSHSSSVA